MLQISNVQQLRKELTQNFSNYNDSSIESCQESSFREVHVHIRANCCMCLNHTHSLSVAFLLAINRVTGVGGVVV